MLAEKYAFFDFDGTLCPGDSIVPYLLFCVREGHCPPGLFLKAAWLYLLRSLTKGGTMGAKEAAFAFLRGHNMEETDRIARAFFSRCLRKRFRQEGVEEIEKCRREGMTVAVVTASAGIYMRVLPEFLPVDAVIATECLTDSEGRFVGKLGPNCSGAEKAQRIEKYLSARGNAGKPAAERAYGNSASDIAMLSIAEQPVKVDPDRALSKAFPSAPTVRWR